MYFLKEKSSAFMIFKEFKAKVERESGCKLISLRSDRGGEYTSNAFKDYCRSYGIRHQLTAAYTPQQNGVAERKNRTIMEMTRALVKERRIPKEYWGEAVACAVYLLNRCPISATEAMTPQEAWSGQRPRISHLRIFGCVAYAQVPEARRKKMDDRGEKGIFIGYSEESKAYKLYHPQTGKVTVSRDVIFKEDECWDFGDGSPTIIEQTADVYKGPTQPTVPATPQQESPQEGASTPSAPRRGEAPHRNISTPVRMRNLDEVYNETEEVNLFCLNTEIEPLTFEEAVAEESWRHAMEEEIHAIEKNDT